MSVHLTGVHLTGVHLMGVCPISVYLTVSVHLIGVHLTGHASHRRVQVPQMSQNL
jgi:hypothetical protein